MSYPAAASSSSMFTFDVTTLMTPEAAPIHSYVDRLAPDGRSIVRDAVRVEPPSPLKRARLGERTEAAAGESSDQQDAMDDHDRYEMSPDLEDEDPPVPPLPRLPRVLNPKRLEPSDKTMHKWMRTLRDIYLIQLLRRDGCGDANRDLCPRCNMEIPKYRCQECTGGALLCRDCCVKEHATNPLHVIFEWTGIFFVKTSLRALGLRIQFGHVPGEACANPQPGYGEFVVLHLNGIHTVNVDFCACDSELRTETYIQLLRAGWYPASDERPQTAATFVLLNQFHLHTLQAKTTAYDFYSVLERLTDSTGIKPPDRYQVFLRMSRQYRHLLMLKRGGRGHDASGVWGTAPGELAVVCPVCPDPNVNLPDGWEKAPPENQFLYVLFLAIDACFRLKRRMISSEIKDPGLGTGWAYVTENPPYRHYLLSVTDQKEMSTCSGLAALDYANTKFSRGYSSTGVGMGVCARHEFVQRCGVGDLQRGERYANMDYIFGSILRHLDHRLRKIVSYDIVCQWRKDLVKRMGELPPLVRFTIVLELFRFVIPKMHIKGHKLDCQEEYSLNLVPGSGQTDGEGIERPWASIGAIATSTRVSGPGARHDALDDHWNFWNWLKTISLPAILRRRLDAARKEQASQRQAFELFSLQQAVQVPEWKRIVEEYEADNTQKNPYSLKISGLTEAEVKLQFATEEEEEAKKGFPALHEVSRSGFITAGLELEDQQRRTRVQAELKKAGTTAMVINMKSLRAKLNRGIAKFRILQATYTPAAIQALAKRVTPVDELPEDIPLMLPSALTEAERDGGGCVKGLVEIENAMREAQCRTTLPRLRNQLHIKSRLLLYKKHNARHQGMNTRSRALVARNESKIRLHSEKFQMAWQARLRLVGGDKSKVGWPQLKKEDIRCMQDPEEHSRNAEKRRKATERRLRKESELREDGLLGEEEDDEMVTRGGESMREISWIWTMAGRAGTDEELQDALRIEWSKAWARSRRWTEEVRLLEEEWRRLPVTYAHREKVWIERAVAVPVGSIPFAEAEGMVAYATKQSQMYRDLAVRAEVMRTEPKLARGKKRQVWGSTWDPIVPMDNGDENDAENSDSDEEDDERGDIDSDEELLLGGEVDDG
ncbi:CxC2 domain-containing protein [Mycena sanguinolenta]|uniref:CxC2 domain-containing protein n=1 Tax=Mycena sanguinolenta TaxID=230812 RepID=A0A8H7CM72_9AGAR|nr:CxC2 domain-containing protein [Mycena sanguinolenta]